MIATPTAPANTALNPAGGAVLELRAVTRTYRSDPPVHAVHDLNLTIHSGEFVAIVGPSGSGKTTALHLMGTLDRPTSGSVYIDGTDSTTLSQKEISALRADSIGFVFQQFHLLETLDVVANVAVGLLYRGVRSTIRHRLATEALARVGMSHRIHHRPNELSGGEQQRVAIARAIVGSPAIVLADEPTGNLDSTNSGAILALLATLNTDGTTIAVVTHERTVADAIARKVEMSDGTIAADTGRRR